MEYEEFAKVLLNSKIERIKILLSPGSSSLSKIPAAFSCTFPKIISVLDANFKKICPKKNRVVAIFNIQPATPAKFTHGLGCITGYDKPQNHFCCILSYLLVSKERAETISSLRNAKNIVVNFTTGEIMDEKHYLYNLLGWHKALSGNVYGSIDSRQLAVAWSIFNKINNKINLNIGKNKVSITFREYQCLIHLSKGKTLKGIGRILGISPKTVENHLANIKQKTNCFLTSQLIDLFWANLESSN